MFKEISIKNLRNNFSLCFVLLILIIVNLNTVNSCYITNCPWGGKRSLSDSNYMGYDITRQCRKCASGLGTCFGPRICCGPDIGCLLDSKESSVCRLEDVKSSVPCTPYGKSCDKVEFGKCATSNLCCNPDHCLEDIKCSLDDQELSMESSDGFVDQDEQNRDLDRKILKALNNLMEKKYRQQQLDQLDELSPVKKSKSHQLKIVNDK